MPPESLAVPEDDVTEMSADEPADPAGIVYAKAWIRNGGLPNPYALAAYAVTATVLPPTVTCRAVGMVESLVDPNPYPYTIPVPAPSAVAESGVTSRIVGP